MLGELGFHIIHLNFTGRKTTGTGIDENTDFFIFHDFTVSSALDDEETGREILMITGNEK